MDAAVVVVDADLTIRDARLEDVDAMSQLRGPRALHDDRVWGAMEDAWRVFVASDASSNILGWETIVFTPPAAGRPRPMVVDLFVATWARSRGVGTRLLAAAERAVMRRGFDALH